LHTERISACLADRMSTGLARVIVDLDPLALLSRSHGADSP
jgi:hypothetical protein